MAIFWQENCENVIDAIYDHHTKQILYLVQIFSFLVYDEKLPDRLESFEDFSWSKHISQTENFA